MTPSSASVDALTTLGSSGIDSLLDAVPDPMIVTDIDGTIVRVSKSAADLLGFDAKNLVGHRLVEVIEENLRAGYEEHRSAFLASPAVTGPELETRFVTASDSVIPIDASVGKLHMDGSTYLLMVMREVSDRLSTQQRLEMMVAIDELTMSISSRLNTPDIELIDRELHASIADLATFCDATAYLFVEGDQGRFTLDCHSEGDSEGAVVSIGLESLPWITSLLDKVSITEVSTTSAPTDESAADCRRLRDEGVAWLVIIPLRASDGTIGFVGIESPDALRPAWPGHDLAGLVVVQDVFENALERSRIGSELRRANRVLHAVSECHDTLIRADDEKTLLKDVCRIVVETGGYALAWVGYALDDSKKTIEAQSEWGEGREFVQSLDLTWHDEGRNSPAASAIMTRKPFAVHDTSSDDRVHWTVKPHDHGFLSLVSIPLFYGDEVAGVLAVYDREAGAFDEAGVKVLQRFADDLAYGIAALRTRERQREAESQLRELLRSKDDFIATIAHELRTPLAGVVGFAQVLRDEDGELDHETRAEMVRLVAEQGMDLTNIVDDLLVAAKSEAGTLQVASVRVDLRAQAAQVIESWGQEMNDRISFEGESTVTTGDPARVRQILRNLVSNALRYGGANVVVRVGADTGHAYVRVEDDGSGISPNERERIFEPYSRAHNAPGLTASMGLGLSISRDLARLMDGDLTYSRDGGVSVFILTMSLGPRTPGD
jgi:PAS domain S-box-containing protein